MADLTGPHTKPTATNETGSPAKPTNDLDPPATYQTHPAPQTMTTPTATSQPPTRPGETK